jgi:salicylate hydroxylase
VARNPSDEPVLIAGGGIAGLSAALALHQRGVASIVIEQAGALDPVGAGIQLSPNATRILDGLGVLDAVAAEATRPEAIELRRAADLRPLARVPLGAQAERRWGSPYFVLHRAGLQSALHAAAMRAGIEVRTGARVTGATPVDGGGMRLSCGGDAMRAGLVIGADGVGSAVRAGIVGASPARFTGKLAWRATIDGAQDTRTLLPLDRVSVFLDAGLHLVAYPVRAGRAINLVAVARGPEHGARDPSPFLSRLAPSLRDACLKGDWSAWPIRVVDPGGRWSDPGGAVLVGDAAHAMSPYAAQGAAMAIEDAAVLADCVATLPCAEALLRYEALRRPRIMRVARRGALNEITWHARGPIALGRNVVLRVAGPERLAAGLDWLYGWRPG